MKDFCDIYNLKNLISSPTYFKSVENPTSIDVFLTNRHNCFQNSCVIETGISDHHKMIITVLKTYFKKIKHTIIKYRSFTNFDEGSFKTDLKYSLSSSRNKYNMNYDEFKNIFIKALNRHAPIKEKKITGNNAPFMNKTLSQSIMTRSKLKNTYNKFSTKENKRLYEKQRNYCTNLTKKV